jgi:hypothetical protein
MLTARLDRPDLYIADELHKRMTFHDLRATGITWMVLRGDSPLVIQHRAGHLDFDTTQLYIREGEALRGDVGEVFPPLPASCSVRPARAGICRGICQAFRAACAKCRDVLPKPNPWRPSRDKKLEPRAVANRSTL